MLDGHIEVGYGLRLYTLGGVDEKQRTFAGGYGAADLVGEVHVARGVDEVENVGLALILVFHLYGVALDGDAALALKVHVVEHLVFGDGYRLGVFQQTVGEGGLAVIDVGDDAEVAGVLHSHRMKSLCADCLMLL